MELQSFSIEPSSCSIHFPSPNVQPLMLGVHWDPQSNEQRVNVLKRDEKSVNIPRNLSHQKWKRSFFKMNSVIFECQTSSECQMRNVQKPLWHSMISWLVHAGMLIPIQMDSLSSPPSRYSKQRRMWSHLPAPLILRVGLSLAWDLRWDVGNGQKWLYRWKYNDIPE